MFCLIGSFFLLHTIGHIGAGIFIPSGSRVLSNNSLITTIYPVLHFIPNFHCLSGSAQPNVGNLIGPLGTDITLSTSDPIDVIHGGSHDPGSMTVQNVRSLWPNDTGIYTYHTPDQNGEMVDFHFGIYYTSSSGMILIFIIIAITCILSLFQLPHFVLTWTMSLLRASTHSPVSHMAPHPPKSCGREMERGYTRTTPTTSSVRFWWSVPAPLITTPSPSMAPLKMWWESTPVLSATPWAPQMNSQRLFKVYTGSLYITNVVSMGDILYSIGAE